MHFIKRPYNYAAKKKEVTSKIKIMQFHYASRLPFDKFDDASHWLYLNRVMHPYNEEYLHLTADVL